MKIVTYNINGIRAALEKGLDEWLKSADPDVVCLQEIKAREEQFDSSVFTNWVIIVIGIQLKSRAIVEQLFYPKRNPLR